MKELFDSLLSLGLPFLIAQAIGPVTTVLSIISTQAKNITVILILGIVVNLMVAASYILLGGVSGSYICLIACVQAAVCYVYARKKLPVPKAVTAVFILCYIAASAVTYQGPADILPGICAVAYALSVAQPNAAAYRAYISINTTLWAVYDISVGAWGMLITHGLLIISLAVAILRQDIKKKDRALPPK